MAVFLRVTLLVLLVPVLGQCIDADDTHAEDKPDFFRPTAVAMSADGRFCAVASRLGEEHSVVNVWNITKNVRVASVGLPQLGGVTELALSPDGGLLAAGNLHGWRLLRCQHGKAQTLISSSRFKDKDRRACGALDFSHDGRFLACGGFGVTVWNTKTAALLKRLELPEQRFVQALTFGRKDETLAIASIRPPNTVEEASQVEVWNWKSKKRVSRLSSQMPVRCLRHSADGSMLLGGGDNSLAETKAEIVVWDVTTGKVRRRFTAHLYPIAFLVFSEGGGLMASSDLAGRIHVWETQKWSRVWQIDSRTKNPAALSFGSNRTKFSSVSGKRFIEIHDVQKQRSRVVKFQQ